MRKAIIILFLCIPLAVNATNYYVATTGNDSNPGTITQPWATWQKGFNSISAGDILYIRGGTYSPTGAVSNNMFCAVSVDSKKGSSANMYNVFAYPGETPILDCRNLSSTSYERYGILLYNSDYWHLNGLEITRCDQVSTGGRYGGQGLMVMNGNYNKIERLVAHDNGGPGLGMRGSCEENLFENCDAYSNWDAYSDTPGDNADGFDIGFITYRAGNERKNYFDGCRAWKNGDDGFDMYQMAGYRGVYFFTNCWAWKQGYRPDGVTQGGNGCGFKYGNDDAYPGDAIIRRSTHNCVAYANRTRGFSQETANETMEFYNNISYNNDLQGFSFVTYSRPDVLKNNISYKNGGDIFASTQIHDHNSWDSNVTVTDADFLSTDGSELERPRKTDGSLPDINFLHLATGSDLIDAGVGVGITFTGKAPDLGAFELTGGSVATSVPVYSSAAIASATPTLLEVTYNTTLANIVPAATAFSVVVNSVARTVNTIAISGAKVQLTMASPVVFGDIVTVSYTKPAANPVQNSSGGLAAAIGPLTVTNNTVAVNPVYVSASVENTTPTLLSITYNMTLANIAPASSAFAVLVNAVASPVSSVAISGAKVQLTIASAIKYGDVVTFSYTKPATKPIQVAAGGTAISISGKLAVNNLVNPTKDAASVTINMTLSPNHVHKIVNVMLAYSSTPTAAISPEVIRIFDSSGKLYIEKKLVTGITNVKVPLNLDSGLYTVKMLGNGIELASKRMVVY